MKVRASVRFMFMTIALVQVIVILGVKARLSNRDLTVVRLKAKNVFIVIFRIRTWVEL